ncbi:hypothetical protein Goklo_003216 [Gossypium klotzschianum]|uniref:Uncharacterized protein n=1 Tax=Gossypium klotzschianum TaxID=34286 RepID=A0A7J8VVM3_9ROSI|nr:hypothetical protein [Gossypium klotzschianum]
MEFPKGNSVKKLEIVRVLALRILS